MKLQPIALGACAVLVLLSLAAIAAPWISPYPPDAMDLQAILRPPSSAHWAGTDELGRDIFSRLLHGARPSLLSAVAIVAIGAIIGMAAGCFSGLVGGVVDSVIMRLVDMMLALPGLVIAMALTAALGPSLVIAVIALGILSIPGYVRLARGLALALREREFVQAARAMGAGAIFIARRHIAPNVAPAMMVYASFHFGGALLASSALSFIGLGMQPPHAEWGAMVGGGREYVLAAWWYVTFPGLVVALGALSANILGDALRDLTD
jgi:peptide/nickel transport system permease protein